MNFWEQDAVVSNGAGGANFWQADDVLPTQPQQLQPQIQPQPSPNFAQRMNQGYEKFDSRMQAADMGNQSYASKKLQQTAAGVLGVADIVGNVAGSAGRYAYEQAPQTFNKVGGYLQQGLQAAQPYVQPLIQGAEKLGQNIGENTALGGYLTKNDEARNNAQALLDLSQFVPAGAPKTVAKGVFSTAKAGGDLLAPLTQPIAKRIAKVGGAVEQSGINKANIGIQRLVMPIKTKKVAEQQVGRSNVNRLGTVTTDPSPQEAAALAEVAKIPKFKPSGVYQKDWNKIDAVNRQKAEALRANLDASNVTYDTGTFKNRLVNTLADLKDEPLIVGDGETTAARIAKKMSDLVDNNPNTPSGLLTARQQFDDWATSKKVSLFDGNETAFSTAVRDVRNAANDHISGLVPDAAVKQSLLEQSNLYTALDNIRPKAAKQMGSRDKSTRATRLVDKLDNSRAGRHPFYATMLLAAPFAGAGAAGTAASTIALGGGAALLGTAAVKAATSATGRKVAGKAIKGVGKAIGTGEPKIPPLTNKIEPQVGFNYAPPPPPPLKQLPAPPKEYVVDKSGQTRLMTPSEQNKIWLERKRMEDLGLTPDVLRAQDINLKNELMAKYGQSDLGKFVAKNINEPIKGGNYAPVTYNEYSRSQVNKLLNNRLRDKVELAERQRIIKEINQIMIDFSDKRQADLAQAIGAPVKKGILDEALRDATKQTRKPK